MPAMQSVQNNTRWVHCTNHNGQLVAATSVVVALRVRASRINDASWRDYVTSR